MLLPTFVAVVYREPALPFVLPGLVISAASAVMLLLTRRCDASLSIRGGFVLVTALWVIASITGATPFLLSGSLTSFADALFESASGFTTTGSSVFADVEILPFSILFWRSLTHWVGGIGIVVIAVSVLPFLGINGYRLMRAEAPGPDFERLTPRIRHTGRILALIYLGLTIMEFLLLVLGGMSTFDALTHSFGTVATGGFSTRNGSIGAYGSPYIQWVVTGFMLLSGFNFVLYYRALKGSLAHVWRNTEARVYIVVYATAVALCFADLAISGKYTSKMEALRHGAFQVATLMSSTGFASADYVVWPGLARGVLLIMLFVGGCSGSTSGGIKIVHVTVLWKAAKRQIRSLLNPQAVFAAQFNRKPLENGEIIAIGTFVFLYVFVVLISTVVLMSTGTNMETGMTATLAAIGNVGPGFGMVGPARNFGFLSDFAKVWLSIVMVLGRLEIFTVIAALPAFLLRR